MAKLDHLFGNAKVSNTSIALTLLAFGHRARAEDQAEYRYEDYAEDGGRVHVRTHGVYVQKEVTQWLSVKGNYIYDGISGATPIGSPPLPGETTVPKATIEDIRRAGFLQPDFKLGNSTISPQVAYSKEEDYESWGAAISHSIELNEKNTTLTWGISHAFDRILPNPGESITDIQHKDTTDFLVGVSQLLNKNTVLSFNLTLGYSDGYLNDPYKRVLFTDFPYNPGQPYTVFPEVRPGHKFRQVADIAVQHYFPALFGSIDANYRFHHDDWDVLANTLTIEWRQKIGQRVILTPLFRYHNQTAASFYAPQFPGDPSCPADIPDCPQVQIPSYYSADYRLAHLQSFTYGIGASVRVHDHVSIELAYQRYDMQGLDDTVADQFPKAHIFSGGITLWF